MKLTLKLFKRVQRLIRLSHDKWNNFSFKTDSGYFPLCNFEKKKSSNWNWNASSRVQRFKFESIINYCSVWKQKNRSQINFKTFFSVGNPFYWNSLFLYCFFALVKQIKSENVWNGDQEIKIHEIEIGGRNY
jgi:hypothetical protein